MYDNYFCGGTIFCQLNKARKEKNRFDPMFTKVGAPITIALQEFIMCQIEKFPFNITKVMMRKMLLLGYVYNYAQLYKEKIGV